MALPRITLNIDFKSNESSGDASLLSIGYGIHQAWIYSAMFSTTTVFALPKSSLGIYGTHFSYTMPASMFVFALALIVMGFFYKKLLKTIPTKKTLVLGAISTTIGCLLLLMLGEVFPDDTHFSVELVSALFTGIGTAILILHWGYSFARREALSIIIDTAFAIVLGLLIYVVFICSLPYPIAGIVTCILPLLEIPILLKHASANTIGGIVTPQFRPLRVRPIRLSIRFGIPVLIAGLALGVLRQSCVQTIVSVTDLEYRVLILFAAVISAAILLITASSYNDHKQGSWNRLFKPLIPVIIAAAVVLPFSANTESSIPHCVLLIGYMVYEMVMWVFCSNVSEHYRLSSTLVFGIGRGSLALGSLFGAFFTAAAIDLLNSAMLEHSAVVVSILIVIFASYLLLPDHEAISSLVYFDEDSGAPTYAIDSAADSMASQQPKNSDCPANRRDSVEVDSDNDCSLQNLPPLAVEKPGDSGPIPAVTQEPVRSKPVSLTRSEIAPPPTQEELFTAECEAVANTFLLSRRETEVCYYLARGHNSSYIQEKLYISEGTAKTHIRHIYRKLSIHSQEELIRLVEEFSTYSA